MDNISVELLSATPLHIASHAIRECHASHDKSDNGGPKDQDLISRVGCKLKHASTLEHLNFSLAIKGISVAVLGQLTRHRLASYTVQSTRYTTGKFLKDEESFLFWDGSSRTDWHITDSNYDRAHKYLVFTDNGEVDSFNIFALDNCRKLAQANYSNDELRYALPQAWRTNLTMTINLRSLRNLLVLRTSSHTMLEFRKLAQLIYSAIPTEYHYLLEDCINDFA